MIPYLFTLCLRVLLSHVPTLLVIIICTVHITPEFIMTMKGFIVKLFVKCSTRIYDFEQSELDVIIDSVCYFYMYTFHMHLCWCVS